MFKVYFTITPDYNRPPDSDGIRTEYVKGEYLVDSIRDGSVSVGDTIIAYFDPEGDSTWEYEGGWSGLATVVSAQVVPSPLDGSPLGVIKYKDITEPR